ncbi:MAG: RDD family protein [Lysobacteraceae bacterium]
MGATRFRARWAAWTLDAAMTAPAMALVVAAPVADALSAWRALQAASEAAMVRAFDQGAYGAFDLVAALQADTGFAAVLTGTVGRLVADVGLALVLVVGVFALWCVGFEASAAQATPGKRLLGLRVSTVDGARPRPARLLLRVIAAAPSWLLLHLGHALVAWRADGRALHDLVAGTRVEGGTGPLPRWAVAWLGLQVAAAVALVLVPVVLLGRVLVVLGA